MQASNAMLRGRVSAAVLGVPNDPLTVGSPTAAVEVPSVKDVPP